MTQQEIQERSEQIVLMLGYKIAENKESFKSPNYNGLTILEIFYSDWNWIMEAVEFIEIEKKYVIKTISSPTLSGKWTIHTITILNNNRTLFKSGDVVVNFKSDYSNNQSKKEAVFIAVSDFAKLYNNKEL